MFLFKGTATIERSEEAVVLVTEISLDQQFV